jgi:hypothetical protein
MRPKHVVQDTVDRDLRLMHLPALASYFNSSGVSKAGRLRALNELR